MRREMHASALRGLGVFYPGRPVDGTTASSGVEWTTMRTLWTLLHSERKYSDRLISVDRDRAPNPALQNNRCHTFLAAGASRAGAPRFDPCEWIETVLLSRQGTAPALRDRGARVGRGRRVGGGVRGS